MSGKLNDVVRELAVEVERTISRHPAVARCEAIPIPSVEWGEILHAVVVRKPDRDLTADEILDFCRRRLARDRWPQSVEICEEPRRGHLREA